MVRTNFEWSIGLLSDDWTEQLLDEAIDGKVKVLSSWQTLNFKLNDKQRRELDDRKRDGFINKRLTNKRVQMVYWKWCEIVRRPVITITPRSKYADVRCDMISVARPHHNLDCDAMNAINKLRQADRRGLYDAGASRCVADVVNVPIGNVDEIAKSVFSIAMDCVKRKDAAVCQTTTHT